MKEIINKINSIHNLINEKFQELEKPFQFYKQSMENTIQFELNRKYDNYENEIIEGESQLDILLEQIDRNNEIRF